ncbi:MAG: peptidylprolyl isomerase [Candidatus Marinimicrobia bacterium]|nr:peptidylprolyl isomerase [Candidatus Neomarinimicrobiota bacterium]
MKRLGYLFLGIVLLLSSCTILSDNDVAVVNGQKIHKNELFRYVPEANFFAMTPEEKERQIEILCDGYLARYYLEDHGDLDSGNVKWEISVWEIRELANLAYNRLIIDYVLSPKAKQNLYHRFKYQINVSHILIAYNGPQKLNERSREEAEVLIGEIAEKVTVDNFQEMADAYSDDAPNEKNGGDLGWGNSGRWVDSFEDVAFYLEPGEISDPVETLFGFHIIKMNERKEHQIAPFEEMEEELYDIAFNRWRNRFMRREQAVFDSLALANPVVFNDSLLTDFIDRFSRLSQNVFYSKQFTAYDILEIFDDTLTIGHIRDAPIDKAWIYQFLKVISLQVPPRFTSKDSFISFIEQNRIGFLLYNAAFEHGWNKLDDFQQSHRVYLAKTSASLFDKRYVFELINPDKESLAEFYEENKGELYLNEATVQVREVLVDDSTFAVGLLDRANASESMADLATEYSKRNIGRKSGGLIPPVKKNQYGEMGVAAFNMADGEISGPFKIGKHYSVIQRVKYIPESYRTIQQVDYRLLTDYRSHYMADKRAAQKALLRKTYRVKVNPSFIE